MPICIACNTLQQITRLALAVRKDGECRIDITSDTIRLRARSEDHVAYFDYSLPTSVPEFSVVDITDDYWVRFEHVKKFLNASPDADVTIRTPAETPDSTITLQSAGLTYRRTPITRHTAHRVFDTISAESRTNFSLPNSVLTRAVDAANLLGTSLRVRINQETHHVKFSAEGNAINDAFSYTQPVEQIRSTHPSSSELTITIDRLRDIASLVPATNIVSLEVTPHHLTYRAEHPVTGANLTVYIAEYLGAIRE